jgi:hypothetical protein
MIVSAAVMTNMPPMLKRMAAVTDGGGSGGLTRGLIGMLGLTSPFRRVVSETPSSQLWSFGRAFLTSFLALGRRVPQSRWSVNHPPLGARAVILVVIAA